MTDPIADAADQKPQRSPAELREALEQCLRRKDEIKASKKRQVKDHNDQLADVDAEIEGLLQQLKPA